MVLLFWLCTGLINIILLAASERELPSLSMVFVYLALFIAGPIAWVCMGIVVICSILYGIAEAIIEALEPFRINSKIKDLLFQMGIDKDLINKMYTYCIPLRRMPFVKQDKKHHPEGTVGQHTLAALSYLSTTREYTKVTILATLFHDVGKVICTKRVKGKLVAHGHETISCDIAQDFFHNHYRNIPLKWYTHILDIIENHMRIKVIHEMKPTKVNELLDAPWFLQLSQVAYADSVAAYCNNMDWWYFLKEKESSNEL